MISHPRSTTLTASVDEQLFFYISLTFVLTPTHFFFFLKLGSRRRTRTGGFAGQTQSGDSDTRAPRHAEESGNISGLRARPAGRARAQAPTSSAYNSDRFCGFG